MALRARGISRTRGWPINSAWRSLMSSSPSPTSLTTFFPMTGRSRPVAFAVGQNCDPIGPDGGNGKAPRPDRIGWHLDEEFSQLSSARDAVQFAALHAIVDSGF